MTVKDAELTKDIVVRPSSMLLWITILTGPMAFIIDFQSRLALVEWACGNHRDWVLHLIALTALVAAVASTLIAWTAFSRLNTLDDLPEHPGTFESGPLAQQRARFMAISGFIISAIFSITIVANELPHFFLRSCD